MKALIITALTVLSVNAFAGSGNANCSANSDNERVDMRCSNSNLSVETRARFNCKDAVAEVKAQQDRARGTK